MKKLLLVLLASFVAVNVAACGKTVDDGVYFDQARARAQAQKAYKKPKPRPPVEAEPAN